MREGGVLTSLYRGGVATGAFDHERSVLPFSFDVCGATAVVHRMISFAVATPVRGGFRQTYHSLRS